MKLTGRLIRIREVTASHRDAMFALMEDYYENMTRSVFEADLDEKQWVIQLTEPRTGSLCGFSTQRLLDLTVDGRPVRILFSGDTIVRRQYRTQNPLAQLWGRFVLSLIEAEPGAEWYWFLMTKGYKTYRFLPVFFHMFYPRHDAGTPAWASAVIHAVGWARYPSSFDPAAGVIRADARACRLRPDVAPITESRRRDPHVRFFAERNPRHACGDELCCLAPLTRENFTPAAWRVIGSSAAAAPCHDELGNYSEHTLDVEMPG